MRLFARTLFIASFALLWTLHLPSATADLKSYVEAKDDAYGWEIVGRGKVGTQQPLDLLTVRLTSQRWRGDAWEHYLTILSPPETVHPESAVLIIHGGRNNADGSPAPIGRDHMMMLTAVMRPLKTTVAVLTQVPNQPILDGRREDAAIAYSFDQYLKTGEEDWPLLLPMVKSAVRAMDCFQEVAREEFDREIERFFVTGGSKRGWTTWLTAAVDDRVFGIAPVIIDTLNMREQMEHQIGAWGEHSRQIGDYAQYDLMARLNEDDPRALALQRMVDPYYYLDDLEIPKLIVIGTNDPYWVVDAVRFYYDDLKGDKFIHYSPNTAHTIDMGGAGAIAAFYDMARAGESLPKIDWEIREGSDAHLSIEAEPRPAKARIWEADAEVRDFRNALWTSREIAMPAEGPIEATVAEPAFGYRAFYAELSYPSGTAFSAGFCTAVKVIGEGRMKPEPLPGAE